MVLYHIAFIKRWIFAAICRNLQRFGDLLPTGSEESEVLGVGSIPVVIHPSVQDVNIIALYCINMYIVGW